MTDQAGITIKITSGVCLGGEGNDVFPGQVLQAPGQITIERAFGLVRTGYAVIIPTQMGPHPQSGTVPILDHRDPALSTHDPVIDSSDPRTPAPAAAHRGRQKPAGGRSE